MSSRKRQLRDEEFATCQQTTTTSHSRTFAKRVKPSSDDDHENSTTSEPSEEEEYRPSTSKHSKMSSKRKSSKPGAGVSSNVSNTSTPSTVGTAGRPLSREQLRKANHSLIERRRREKMNAAYKELRGLVPSLADEEEGKGGETFKLEVLERTVDHMKELKDRVANLEIEVERREQSRRSSHKREVSSPHSERTCSEEEDEDVDMQPPPSYRSPLGERPMSPPPASDWTGSSRRTTRSPRETAGAIPLSIRNSPLSRNVRSPTRTSYRSNVSLSGGDADSEATVPETCPPAGSIHPSSDKAKSMTSGSSSSGGSSSIIASRQVPQTQPELSRDNDASSSSMVAILAAESNAAAASTASTATTTNGFGRFALPNLPSEAARAARVAVGAGEIRNPDLYLPPPVNSASPCSPFFMVDPGREDGSGWANGNSRYRNITEPSPLLPPSLGVSSLFPGVAGLRQESLDSGRERDPIAQWRRSPPTHHPASSSTTSTTGSSIGLTDDSPRFFPSNGGNDGRSGSVEEQAATLLLSFSSPEVLTPMHYPSNPGHNGSYGPSNLGFLDKWTLDQSQAENGKRHGDSWGDKENVGTLRAAKTASDILEMGRHGR